MCFLGFLIYVALSVQGNVFVDCAGLLGGSCVPGIYTRSGLFRVLLALSVGVVRSRSSVSLFMAVWVLACQGLSM